MTKGHFDDGQIGQIMFVERDCPFREEPREEGETCDEAGLRARENEEQKGKEVLCILFDKPS